MASDPNASAAPVAAASTSSDGFGEPGDGEDPLAFLADACAKRGAFEASPPLSEPGLHAALEGRWGVCPESLEHPDPLFGNAGWIGIELFDAGGARALLADGGGATGAPTAFLWRTLGPSSFELSNNAIEPRTFDVVVARDGGALEVTRRDLGDTVYRLVRVP